MFEAEYLIFCAGNATDENGNLSLDGIFDRVYSTDFPVQHKPFVIIIKLKAKKAIIKQHLKMKVQVELENKEANRVDIEGDFTIEKGNSITPAFDVGQFVFPKAGTYHIKFYVGDQLLVTRILDVRSADELTEK